MAKWYMNILVQTHAVARGDYRGCVRTVCMCVCVCIRAKYHVERRMCIMHISDAPNVHRGFRPCSVRDGWKLDFSSPRTECSFFSLFLFLSSCFRSGYSLFEIVARNGRTYIRRDGKGSRGCATATFKVRTLSFLFFFRSPCLSYFDIDDQRRLVKRLKQSRV